MPTNCRAKVLHGFFVMWICLHIAGCAGTSTIISERVIWPLPPASPKIEFVGVITSDRDIKTETAFDKHLENLAGGNSYWEFSQPFGIAIDQQDRVFVSDSIQRNIRVFDFVKGEVSHFAPQQEFAQPLGLAISNKGNVYVADAGRGRVVVLAPDGEFLHTIGEGGKLAKPSFISIHDGLQRLYVVDGPRHQISVFTLQGEPLFTISGQDEKNGRFFLPQGLAFDSQNRLLVADMLKSRIQIFTPDGLPLGTFGVQGDDYWNFENPRDIKAAADGTLIVVDFRKALLQNYTGEGKILFVLGNNRRSRDALGFSTPTSLAIDSKQKVFIVDSLARRLSVWQLLTDDYLARHPLSAADIKKLAELGDKAGKH